MNNFWTVSSAPVNFFGLLVGFYPISTDGLVRAKTSYPDRRLSSSLLGYGTVRCNQTGLTWLRLWSGIGDDESAPA